MRYNILALISAVFLLATSSAAQSFTFASIDVPCSGCAGGIAKSTTAFGINPAGDIVGAYTDTAGQHGFLLTGYQLGPGDLPDTLVITGGQFSTIEVPASMVGEMGSPLATAARGINPSGNLIVGSFTARPNAEADPTKPDYCPAAGSTYCVKGYLYDRRTGKFSLVLYPGDGSNPAHVGAIAQRITATGDIYGCLHDYDMMSTMYGFGMSRSGNSSLQQNGRELVSGAPVQDSMETGATPDDSIRVGLYGDMTSGFQHGYKVETGLFQTYDVPGPLQTNIYDVNPAGNFVGIYIACSGETIAEVAFCSKFGSRRGFLQLADGSAPITLNYPTAMHTRAYGINPGGAIVGHYIETNGPNDASHGFLAVPASTN